MKATALPIHQDAIVVANAGAGKTTLLVQHYFELIEADFDPAGIIAFTFTEKAAGELKERIQGQFSLQPYFKDMPRDTLQDWKQKLLTSPIGTIHQFCLGVIQEAYPPDKTLNLRVVEEATEIQLREKILQTQLRARLLDKEPDSLRLLGAYGISALKQLLRDYISRQDPVHALPPRLPDPTEEEQTLLFALKALADPIREEFEREKMAKGWLNFDDMERQALALIKNPTNFLKRKLGIYSHVLLDEFQDTSPIQLQVLEALRLALKKKPLRLFCVGDPKQSIYRFRKVDRNLISKMENKILAEGGTRLDSVKNYRSGAPLLEFINVFAANAFPDSLPSVPHSAEPAFAPWLITIPMEQDAANADLYRQQEAKWVALQIEELLSQGDTPEEIAVLYRSSASSLPLVEELQSRKIHFSIKGGQELWSRQEILDLKRLLLFLDNPSDTLSLIGVLRAPFFLLSDATLMDLTRRAEKETLASFLLSGRYLHTAPQFGSDETPKLNFAVESLRQLIQWSASLLPSALLRQWTRHFDLGALYSLAYEDKGRFLAMEQFIDWLEQIEEENAPINFSQAVQLTRNPATFLVNKTPLGNLIEDRGAVRLMTIHAAKGLEYESVFLIDLERAAPANPSKLQNIGGDFGLKYPAGSGEEIKSQRFEEIKNYHLQEEREEDKRLLYVAMTRAKQRLLITLHPKPKRKDNLQSLLLEMLGEKAKAYHRPFDWPPEATLPRNIPAPGPVEAQEPFWKQSPAETTVSELETFQLCALKHHYLFDRKIPDTVGEDPLAMTPAQIGTLFHGVLKILHAQPQKTLRNAFETLLHSRRHSIQSADLDRLAADFQAYLDSPPARLFQEASEDYSELPFLLRLPGGSIRGQIDRLLRTPRGWVLIDFKYLTRSTSATEIQQAYGFQLKTYALALRQILNEPLVSTQIHLLIQRKILEFHFHTDELDRHQSHLGEIMGRMKTPNLESIRLIPHCHGCVFNQKLPLCPVPQGAPWNANLGISL